MARRRKNPSSTTWALGIAGVAAAGIYLATRPAAASQMTVQAATPAPNVAEILQAQASQVWKSEVAEQQAAQAAYDAQQREAALAEALAKIAAAQNTATPPTAGIGYHRVIASRRANPWYR